MVDGVCSVVVGSGTEPAFAQPLLPDSASVEGNEAGSVTSRLQA